MAAPRDRFWPDETGLFDDPVLLAAIDTRAEADIAAHRLVDHAAVVHWLACWGDDLPLLPLP